MPFPRDHSLRHREGKRGQERFRHLFPRGIPEESSPRGSRACGRQTDAARFPRERVDGQRRCIHSLPRDMTTLPGGGGSGAREGKEKEPVRVLNSRQKVAPREIRHRLTHLRQVRFPAEIRVRQHQRTFLPRLLQNRGEVGSRGFLHTLQKRRHVENPHVFALAKSPAIWRGTN